jgi:hypothetical protein
MKGTTTSRMRSRGINTLIGNGWLREPPRPIARGWGDARGRSAMRKCMFLQVPTELRQLMPQVSPAAMPLAGVGAPLPPRPAPDYSAPVRRNPEKFVRQMPATPQVPARLQPAVHAELRAAGVPLQAWWEDPIAIGSLLIIVPPIGLAALWSSQRYSSDARWALTLMTALMMCLMTAVTVAVAVLRG